MPGAGSSHAHRVRKPKNKTAPTPGGENLRARLQPVPRGGVEDLLSHWFSSLRRPYLIKSCNRPSELPAQAGDCSGMPPGPPTPGGKSSAEILTMLLERASSLRPRFPGPFVISLLARPIEISIFQASVRQSSLGNSSVSGS